jgi:hypothetical protein
MPVFAPVTVAQPIGTSSMEIDVVSVSTDRPVQVQVNFFDINGSEISFTQLAAIPAFGTGHQYVFLVPFGTYSTYLLFTWAGAMAGAARFTWVAAAYCNGTLPGQSVQPCCPPDPTQAAMLAQILQQLQLVYASLPSHPNSYAEASAHAGLTGDGSIVLVDDAIAIKVAITTDISWGGVAAGDPPFLFDRGYITPFNSEGPIYASNRLTFNPQVFLLPTLTDSIGYSLPPGEIITITELTAGP